MPIWPRGCQLRWRNLVDVCVKQLCRLIQHAGLTKEPDFQRYHLLFLIIIPEFSRESRSCAIENRAAVFPFSVLARQRLAFPRGHFILPGGPAKDSAAGASRMPHPTTQGSEGNHGPPYRVSAWPGQFPGVAELDTCRPYRWCQSWPPAQGRRPEGDGMVSLFLCVAHH